MMSEDGRDEDSLGQEARKKAEKIDPAERKMSDLMGMDEQEEETSREAPNSPPRDENVAQGKQPG
jgi:hypothetical protein